MFYSQFILAKKGPLGTIWIAAHLERKLRKNQVADTDIGVSVDSILFPDVPIALRLSSHLLLGVVRIYNRKVNYLFDDCSEALLKVKQTFRSTAVDLPPEESKAPYHSITLPETFDLDDFELPDNDIFQGNYVDHHISSREQITLQDSMEGVSYSTSKFGLDERFGDGDVSRLDLDEELFLDKVGTAGHADESVDPQASVRSMLPLKHDEHPEDRAANSETMVDGVDDYADLMDYAQAPRTPGLVEEPNLSNVQDANDHMELEYQLTESTTRENAKGIHYEDKQEVEWCTLDDAISDAAPQCPPEENGYQLGGLEIKESKPQEESAIGADVESISLKESSSVSEPTAHLSGQVVEAISPASELADKIIKASDVPCTEDAHIDAVNEDKTSFHSVDETSDNHQGPKEIGLEKGAFEISDLVSTGQKVSDGVSTKDLSSLGLEIPGCVENTSNQQKSCHDASEFALENQVGSFLETPETRTCQETKDSCALNLVAHDKEASSVNLVLRPCSSILEQPIVTKSGCGTIDADVQSDIAALATYGKGETAKLEQSLKENQVQEHASGEDIHAASGEADGQVHNTNAQDRLVESLNNSVESELPAPEKLLSVPESHVDLHRDMLVEVSFRDVEGLDEGDAGSKTAAGRKRSFTESTLTEQSLNTVESSRLVRVKRTTESVPDDDDLLSSILVGRISSLLKVKPTPPLSEVTSMKRTRSALRSGAPKRKVLMDDTMVLHGDMIRQQLTNTEDIRRVRKKAPCTWPEISIIQKQHLEDEMFIETLFTGMSVDLASLHSQVYDLSQIRVCQNDVNDASLENMAELRMPSPNDENGVSLETVVESKLASHNDKYGASRETLAELNLSSPNNENIVNHDMENDEAFGKTNVTEQSGQEVNSELLIVRENEIAEPHENPLLNENRLEDVDRMNMEVNVSQELIKPSNNVGIDDSQQEILLDVAELETSQINAGDANHAVIAEVEALDSVGHATIDIGGASADMVRIATLNESGETNSYVNIDASAVIPHQKTDAHSVDLDSADVDDGQAISRDEVTGKDGDVNGEHETELGARHDILPDVAPDVAVVELVPNAKHGDLEFNVQNDIYNATSEEQPTVGSPYPALVHMLDDGPMNNGENPYHPEAYQPNMTYAEISGSDLYDRDELNYSAAGNDTEFLNVDDDELTEIADDYMPDAEETRFTENIGWSSRTRAVSKYLQTIFVKEADCGRKSLYMDNLLIGKSRKEASRMFFETLVLKTRDYIHVEQRNPFDDITLKPRTRLMKSDF